MPTDLRRGWEGVGEASPDGTCWIRGSGSQGIKHALVPYEVRFFFAQCRHHQESKSRYVLGPFRVWALKLLVCGAVHPIYTLKSGSVCSSLLVQAQELRRGRHKEIAMARSKAELLNPCARLAGLLMLPRAAVVARFLTAKEGHKY